MKIFMLLDRVNLLVLMLVLLNVWIVFCGFRLLLIDSLIDLMKLLLESRLVLVFWMKLMLVSVLVMLSVSDVFVLVSYLW